MSANSSPTLLLNFVGTLLAYYVSTGPWLDPGGHALGTTARVRHDVPEIWVPVHWGLPLAILLTSIVAGLLNFTAGAMRSASPLESAGREICRHAVPPPPDHGNAAVGAIAGIAGMLGNRGNGAPPARWHLQQFWLFSASWSRCSRAARRWECWPVLR